MVGIGYSALGMELTVSLGEGEIRTATITEKPFYDPEKKIAIA